MASEQVVTWRGGRSFTQAELDLIFLTAREYPGLSRTELASTLCEILPWKAPNGKIKKEACMLLLEHLEETQGLVLPGKQPQSSHTQRTDWGDPPPCPSIHASLKEVKPVKVELVDPSDRHLWNAMMAAYHPLGFRRAFGAHLRYFVYGHLDGSPVILGGLLFAAAAKTLLPRDAFIGWDRTERPRFLHHVVSNSRYLILPGVHVPHLASFVLARALSRLQDDYRTRYGYAPSLVETFIEPPWRGTCYRAAGFLLLGTTQGRGRQDRHHRYAESVKQVLVRPLSRHWKRDLFTEDVPVPEEVWEDA